MTQFSIQRYSILFGAALLALPMASLPAWGQQADKTEQKPAAEAANTSARSEAPAAPEAPAASEAAPAPAIPPPPKRGTLSFLLENDLFTNTDRHYTNGVHMSWLTAPEGQPGGTPGWAAEAARMLPLLEKSPDIRVELALGQSMYTPRDITLVNPPPEDRPYAGWLYGTLGVIADTERHLDQVQIGLGIVGPASLAEQSQKTVHEIINSREPKGWDSQLKTEPTLQFTYQRSWRHRSKQAILGLDFDAVPHAGVNLGNALTYANSGVMLRVGHNIPVDYGPPRVQPSLPGSGYFQPTGPWGFYLFAGVDGRAVGRNMFLDGNTFADSRSVDKKTFVGDLQFGAALYISNVRFAYTHVVRSREFETQEQADRFGALSVSMQF
ncbi:lipid A deacylase LpxR family protein [Ferrovibrio sp.]|uniref:lipid A deacylase LpxR family protein n=1 Tax=Ferrovibrio sp. TaxID=1917215 RepID=UPI0025B9CC0E|nr:lipid A deacylase LpxR family protein [Ferrovibrio sp.]MBX3455225.1 lipid A deacylase LpxR family protein [Ferrovibrio sp.]